MMHGAINMKVKELLIAEWERESANTKRMLQAIPEEKLSWKPHEKSKELGALAYHVAGIPERWAYILDHDVFDPTVVKAQPQPDSKEGIVSMFESGSAALMELLNRTGEADYGREFTFEIKGRRQFTMPRAMGISTMLMGHLIHHRAQISVYLRLLNVPVPGMYGPSADDNPE